LGHYSLYGCDDSRVAVGFLEYVLVKGPDGLGRASCKQAKELTFPEEEGSDTLWYGECKHPVRDALEEFLDQPIAPERDLLRRRLGQNLVLQLYAMRNSALYRRQTTRAKMNS